MMLPSSSPSSSFFCKQMTTRRRRRVCQSQSDLKTNSCLAVMHQEYIYGHEHGRFTFWSAASISCCSNCILCSFCSSILFFCSSSLAFAICSNRARMSTFCLNGDSSALWGVVSPPSSSWKPQQLMCQWVNPPMVLWKGLVWRKTYELWVK